MRKNVDLIYQLIQNDLRAEGWDDESIAEAIAECRRERLSVGADNNTICVKEMSYLSKESLERVSKQINNKKNKPNIFVRFKNWVVKLVKKYRDLNLEAKVGVLFLIPPIIGAILFILNLLVTGFVFSSFPNGWNIIYENDYYHSNHAIYAVTPAIPIYLGLMAVAGAYLIKGNMKKK